MYESKEERDALFNFLGKYTEVDLLNKKPTGFGWAVLVQDNWEGKRQKVVKLPNKEDANRELLAEAEILTKISEYVRHPNLIELKSVERYVIEWNGRKEERWFLVLAFGGTSLRQRLGRLGMRSDGIEYVYMDGKPLALDEVLRIGTQCAEGLRALHEFEEAPGQHIIHRDIKPENILIDASGTARLADFGISRIVERLTQSITVMGTPPYLPPEYARGALHAMSDIYALGIVLYEMATGTFPFRTTQDKFFEMPKPAHEVNPAVPPSLSEVIQRCLWWDPNAPRDQTQWQRYQTAAELCQDLQKCYRRIYPVPPRFTKLRDAADHSHGLYRDEDAQSEVRIFLYPTEQPRLAATRVLPLISQKLDDSVLPIDAFESEGTLGVVVPQAASGQFGLATGRPQSAEDWQRLVDGTIALARQLGRLHQLGIYHGLLHPGCILREAGRAKIDEIWLGQLVGITSGLQVLSGRGDLPGYLGPEILQWRMPPTLASDIYGLAALLHGAITGQPPMEPGATLEITRHGAQPPLRTVAGLRSKAPGISRRLEGILIKALQTEPAQRHRSLDQFIEELEKCRWPNDAVETLVADARDAQKLGRVVEAYEMLDQALLIDPGNPLIHHARAVIYFLEGEPKWALKENIKALQIQATEPVLLLHGQCLMALGRYDEAEELIREAIAIEDTSRGRHMLAQCLEKIGRTSQAIAQLEQALAIAKTESNTALTETIQSQLSALLARHKE